MSSTASSSSRPPAERRSSRMASRNSAYVSGATSKRSTRERGGCVVLRELRRCSALRRQRRLYSGVSIGPSYSDVPKLRQVTGNAIRRSTVLWDSYPFRARPKLWASRRECVRTAGARRELRRVHSARASPVRRRHRGQHGHRGPHSARVPVALRTWCDPNQLEFASPSGAGYEVPHVGLVSFVDAWAALECAIRRNRTGRMSCRGRREGVVVVFGAAFGTPG
jgi:hypothetical protein